MNVAHYLVQTASLSPNNPAIFRGEHCLFNYREFAARAAALAGALRGLLALQPGDRVALFMTNCPEYLEILYGIWWAGLVAVPINAKLHPRELAYILENAEAKCVFMSADLVEEAASVVPHAIRAIAPNNNEYAGFLDSAAHEITPRANDDLAWLFYTSGTTGKPKGVMLTHQNLRAMTSAYFTDVDAVEAADAIIYAAPFSHGAGLYNFTHIARAARHVVPVSGGFDAAELAALARQVGRVSMFAAPTIVNRLVAHVEVTGADVSGFKTIVYGGAPMYAADIRRALDVMGNRFVQIYGQGECPMCITVLARKHLADRAHPRWRERIASIGVAQSPVEVRIADEAGHTVAPGETGEILVRGAPVMQGYWRNAAATAATIREGWLWTGDLGSIDADGFITLKDRSKDVIISGGSNIYPREVEDVIRLHASVCEVSVVGQRDDEWGEVVVAFVVGEVRAEELDQLCLENIARFKRPKRYVFLDALPKNNYGKVLKSELRNRLKAQ